MDDDINRVMQEAEDAVTGNYGSKVLDYMAKRLGANATPAAVFGEPVVRSGVTVIPVAKVRWGFGGGGGTGSRGEGDAGEGSGGGGGVMASPIGFIEIREGSAAFHRIPPPPAMIIIAAAFAAWVSLRGVRRILRG